MFRLDKNAVGVASASEIIRDLEYHGVVWQFNIAIENGHL